MKLRKLPSFSFCALAFLLAAAVRAETVFGEPDAYLDYVEATGSQYIDTGVYAQTGLKARFDCVLSSGTQNDSSFLDAKYGANRRFMMIHSYQKKYYFAIGDGDAAKRTGGSLLPFDTRFEYVSDVSDGTAVQLYFNGKSQVAAESQAKSAGAMPNYGVITPSDMNNLTLYLFAGNFDGTPKYFGKGKLYELKIFKKNGTTGALELVRHYLPCIKNGRAGLYDKASGTISFSYDANGEDFVAGPVLDKPLALVESITSSASALKSRQCFNTWVYGKSGLKSEVEVSLLAPAEDSGILASRETSGNTRFFMAYQYQSAFRFATGALKEKTDLNVVATATGKRYVIKTDTTPGAQSMTVSTDGGEAVEVLKDGVDYGSSYMTTTNTLFLLATHRAYDNHFASPVNATLYGAKIWDGDELLRDFVPAVATNSAGVAYAGLYDKVAARIYKPIQADVKIETDLPFDLATQVGGITNVLVDVAAPKMRLEYVDSDGTSDYVNLGVVGKDGVEMDAVMEWLAVPKDGAFVSSRVDGPPVLRFNLYNYWPKTGENPHRIGYGTALRGASTTSTAAATANRKYWISTRLDAGDQLIAIKYQDDGAWAWESNEGGRTADDPGPIDTGLPLYLFAGNHDGKPDYYGQARVYSLKLRVKQQDGSYAPARDLVPVRDPLTGGAALWDRVSETYLRNSGRYLLAGGGTERPFEGPFMLVVR